MLSFSRRFLLKQRLEKELRELTVSQSGASAQALEDEISNIRSQMETLQSQHEHRLAEIEQLHQQSLRNLHQSLSDQHAQAMAQQEQSHQANLANKRAKFEAQKQKIEELLRERSSLATEEQKRFAEWRSNVEAQWRADTESQIRSECERRMTQFREEFLAQQQRASARARSRSPSPSPALSLSPSGGSASSSFFGSNHSSPRASAGQPGSNNWIQTGPQTNVAAILRELEAERVKVNVLREESERLLASKASLEQTIQVHDSFSLLVFSSRLFHNLF